MKTLRGCCGLLLLLGVFNSLVLCQTESARLSGRVTDPSGAIVAHAAIEAINNNTNARVVTETNADGLYYLPSLPPGSYRVVVSKDGFKQVIQADVVLQVQDVLTLNFGLQVGSVSETVTVTGGASMVNTNDASVSTVVDQSYVKNMPLNGRSLQDLILLAPGVQTQSPMNSLGGGEFGVGQTGEFAVNGQRTESNYYTVDGVSANTGFGGVAQGGNPFFQGAGGSGSVGASTALGTTQALVSVDELQEFRVLTSSYSAEYGRNPGAQFVFETKSGNNQFHGSAYDYLRNDSFDANDWFNDYNSVRQSALRQNDFGGTLGGPVRIPHLYDGKDKTFFFFNYEGLRLIQPQPASTVFLPDYCMRGLVTPGSPGLCEDATGNPYVNSNGNNRTPADPALLPAITAFPVATAEVDPTDGVGKFIGTWSNPSTINTTSIRLDHVIRDKTRLFFRFSNTLSSSTSLAFLGGGISPTEQTVSNYTMRTYTGGATTLISNRLSNEFRLNYTSNANLSSDTLHAFGGGVPVNLTQLTGLDPSALVEVYGFLGPYFFFEDQTKDAGSQRQWNLVDTMSYSLGRHQLKFGVDYRRLTPFAVPQPASVVYGYGDEPSMEAPNSTAAFLVTAVPSYPLFRNLSLFAQDEWKVTRRLNLSLGLRWELNPPPTAYKGTEPYTIQGTSPENWTLAAAGTPMWKTTYYNFAPRLGAAYTVRDSSGWETVVRGGGGLFFDTGQQLGGLKFGSAGFFQDSCCPTISFPGNPSSLLPQIVNPPQPPFFNLSGIAPHLQQPYTIEWNASVEQALGKSQTFTVSYVASKSGRLLEENSYPESVNHNPILFPGTSFFIYQNGQGSNYNSLQSEFQRRLTGGLTAMASYTWSHCIDSGSLNFDFGYERGNCAIDVRHNFSAAFSYDLPNAGHGGFADAILHHWGIDDRFMARTGFPVDVAGNSFFNPQTGNRSSNGISFVAGQPTYIYGAECQAVFSTLDSQQLGQPVTALPCPGGRAINPNAFESVNGFGDVPRNSIRGFGAWQMNLAVRREFPIYERLKLQFRAEAFNVFNHPAFGFIDGGCGGSPGTPGCTNTLFGLAQHTLANSLAVLNPLYQVGGNRSMQFALKLVF